MDNSTSRSASRSSSRTAVSAWARPNSSRAASSAVSSRNGLSSSICSTSWLSSRVDSCNKRIDCCSCGVSARCCETRRERPCFTASPQRPKRTGFLPADTVEPASPGHWWSPLQGGGSSGTKSAKPGGVPFTSESVRRGRPGAHRRFLQFRPGFPGPAHGRH